MINIWVLVTHKLVINIVIKAIIFILDGKH
jgi:hypothetical protein